MSMPRALLIGNSTFPQDPHNLPELRGPVNDLPLLHDALTDPEVGLFKREDVRLLPERGKREIMTALEEMLRRAVPDDLILLYYSGHGLQDEYDHLYLCAHDTRSNLLLSTAISDAEINSVMRSSAAKTFVVILDCCYSGAFKSGGLPTKLWGEGRFLITSSRHAQLSADAPDLTGPSAFTSCLVDALKLGTLDPNDDGYVGLNDVYEYVYQRLSSQTKQIPQRHFDHVVGDVVLARVRRTERDVPPTVAAPERPPLLDVSETRIEHYDVQPGARLPPQSVLVFNRGGGELDWIAESDAPWIHVEPEGNSIKLQFDPQPGTNRGNVHVRDRGGGGARSIHVLVQVQPQSQPPRLRLSATSLDFGIINVGEPRSTLTVELFNIGGGVLSARVWSNEPWLHVRQLGQTLEVSVDTAQAGDLRGEIHVASDGGGGRISVAATVGRGPVLMVRKSVDFGKVPEESTPLRSVPVRNAGTGELSWSIDQSGDFFVAMKTRFGVEVRLKHAKSPGVHRGSFSVRSNGGDAKVDVTATVVGRSRRPLGLRRWQALVVGLVVLVGVASALLMIRAKFEGIRPPPQTPSALAPPLGAPGPVAAVSRMQGNIDIFWIDRDGNFQTIYFNETGWHRASARLHEQIRAQADPRSAVAVAAPPDGSRLTVFWRRSPKGTIGRAFWPEVNGGWGTAADLTPDQLVRSDSPIVAVSGGAAGSSVFWVDQEGQISVCTVRDPAVCAIGEISVVPGKNSVAPGSSMAVVAPPKRPMQLFWVRPDRTVATASSRDGGRTWRVDPPVGQNADPSSGVAAAAVGDHVEVFWASNGRIRSAVEEGGKWAAVPAASGQSAIRSGSSLAAAALGGGVVAFWVGRDGLVHTNRSPDPSMADTEKPSPTRSGLVAFAHGTQVDVVWVTKEGAIMGNFHGVGSDPVPPVDPTKSVMVGG